MVSFKDYFDLLHESFDTVSDFLLNPEHRDKTFWDLMKEFEASGGKQIGSGKYGTVYSHPKWPYVIKTFNKDDHYLKFVRFAYKNPYPPFPKFYGPPQKIVPFYTREERDKELYISRIEKLEPLEPGEFDEINKNKHTFELYMAYKREPRILDNHFGFDQYGKTLAAKRMKELKQFVDDLPREIYNVLVGADMLNHVIDKEHWNGVEDWHNNNIMKRANGEYVLIDPVWEGYFFNPYAEADRYAEKESGQWGEEPDPDYVAPKPLRGGELPKTKRIKKPKPVNIRSGEEVEVHNSDEIPF